MLKKIFIIILLLSSVTTSFGQSIYVTVQLPKGISIDIPRNWIALSNNEKIDLSAFSEAITKGIVDLDWGFEILHFAANYYNKQGLTEALVNLRYYPDSELSQKDVEDMSDLIIEITDMQMERDMRKMLKKAGSSILEWKGFRKERIGNLIALVTEYRRRSPLGGSGRVRLMMFHNEESSFHMTVSYHDKKHNSFMLKAITDKIISSLSVKGY
jgi:hypothetical protein